MVFRFWTGFAPRAGVSGKQAAQVEQDGWDGLVFPDTQCLTPDVYVSLATAAAATSTLLLAPGVTNPVTRDASVTAGAIWTLNIESGGRVSCGIGRGDSALAHLGLPPASVPAFERYLSELQTYLSGQGVAVSRGDDGRSLLAQAVVTADAPGEAVLHWLPSSRGTLAKPPVFVTATGPRVIRAAARHADCVLLCVGADPERIQWGIQIARAVNPAVRIGVLLPVVVHKDVDAALDIGRTIVTGFARFQAMYGFVQGPADAATSAEFHAIASSYQATAHFRSEGSHSSLGTIGFASRFGILGPADKCIDRLNQLVEMGVEDFLITGPRSQLNGDTPEAISADHAFVADVLPAVREAAAS
jgi:5,10-methylenetetrahydromethanopterin reductase